MISKIEDRLLFFQFLVSALVVGGLSSRVASRERAYARQDKQSRFLFDLSQKLSEGDDIRSLVKTISKSISDLLPVRVGIFLRNSDLTMKSRVEAGSSWNPTDKEVGVAHWAFSRMQRAGRQSDTLRDAVALHIPMISASRVVGVLSVRANKRRNLRPDEIGLLELVASTSAVALDRALAQNQLVELQTVERSEKLFKSIFSSVSHELRTPITLIRGFLETAQSKKIDVSEPLSSLERLEKIVSNLLDTTRIEAGTLRPRQEWTDLSDVIQTAIAQLGSAALKSKFRIELPPKLSLLMLDHSLTSQALFNVLWNATIYASTSPVFFIRVEERDSRILVHVDDQGPGVKDNEREEIFNKFTRGESSKPGGLGLGLSIARTFVELQQGRMWAENRSEGGLRVTMSFPIPEGSTRIEHS